MSYMIRSQNFVGDKMFRFCLLLLSQLQKQTPFILSSAITIQSLKLQAGENFKLIAFKVS